MRIDKIILIIYLVVAMLIVLNLPLNKIYIDILAVIVLGIGGFVVHYLAKKLDNKRHG